MQTDMQTDTGTRYVRAVDYRLRVRNPRGLHVVEQRAYFDLDGDGRIARMHVVCAGFRPVPG